MTKTTLSITGMHCNGCALSAEQALRLVPAVRGVTVDYETARAEIEWDDTQATEQDLEQAVERAGFAVERTAEDG